jgi:hypothetical protein
VINGWVGKSVDTWTFEFGWTDRLENGQTDMTESKSVLKISWTRYQQSGKYEKNEI